MFQSLKWWSRSLVASFGVCGPGSARLLFGVAMTGALGMAPAGLADVVRVEPRIVVVEKDSTPMRCAPGMPFYVVNSLQADRKLRVDGEEGTWLRVEYLSDMLAFVKAEDAALDPDGKVVKLTRPSRLAAVNDRGNERGHWWSLLEAPLPADTVLRVHQIITAMNEMTTGYLVVAPVQSRGYVKADSVRNATTDEAIAFQDRTDVEAPQIAAVTSGPGGAPAPGTGGADADAACDGVPVKAIAGDDSPAEVIRDIETLKARYSQVMTLKDEEASERIQVVIAELNRTAATLGTSNEDRQLRSAVDWCISALRLRQEILATLKSYSRESTIASSTRTRE